MGLFPNFKDYTKDNWLVLVGSGLFGAYTWNLHFIIEFSVLINAKATTFIYIIFHLLFISLGAILYSSSLKRLNNYWLYISVSFLLGSALILMLFTTNLVIISALLAVAGFNIGIGLGAAHYHLTYFFNDQKFGGRMYSLALLSIAPFMIIESVIDKAGSKKVWLNVVFLVIIFLLIITSIVLGMKNHTLFVQEEEKYPFISGWNKHKWSLLFAIFWGFFFTNTYYSVVNLLEIYDNISYLNTFVIEVAALFLIFSYPAGTLSDLIGRRATVLTGFFIQALGFLGLPFFKDYPNVVIVFFPLTIGLGFTFSIISGLVLMFEQTTKNKVREYFTVHIIFIGIGMASGALIGWIMKSTIRNDPVYFSLILLFIFFLALIFTAQVEETLPSANELEWRKTLLFLMVMSKSGTTLYKHRFDTEHFSLTESESFLITGAIKAMTEILQDVARNKEPLKLIKQQNFSILIEDSDNLLVAVLATADLKEIRKKMREFITEFNNEFSDNIKNKVENEVAFITGDKLIAKVFRK